MIFRTAHQVAPAAARNRLLAAVMIPAMTLAALATSIPVWGQALLIGAQAVALWLLWSRAARPTAPAAPQICEERDRATLTAMLAGDPNKPGAQGAALVLRLDEGERLLHQHGTTRLAALIEALGRRLATSLRVQDAFCPLGNDGFAVALFPQRGLTLGVVLAVCQRIQSNLSHPVALDGVTIWPSLSIGFATSARAARLNGLDLLQAAEAAAEKALRAGPGSVTSYSVVDFPSSLTGDRVAELTRALESGEIRAFFQPQIRTDTGRVSGLEALARWVHPRQGLISPAEFLPQIEAAGLSTRLTECMLRDSLATLAALDAGDLAVPSVAINLSAADLRNPRLAEQIAWELDKHDLQPDRLVVEILETVVADSDDDIAVRTIARLAGMGCAIDLDDFGTGHASIANLRRFAVGRIKIDRSFVTRMHLERDRQRMVAAILSMAGELGLDTLAEGVECAEEQVLLAQMGCGHLQGFAIARPMPAADLPGWLRLHEAALAQGEPECEDPVAARQAPGAMPG